MNMAPAEVAQFCSFGVHQSSWRPPLNSWLEPATTTSGSQRSSWDTQSRSMGILRCADNACAIADTLEQLQRWWRAFVRPPGSKATTVSRRSPRVSDRNACRPVRASCFDSVQRHRQDLATNGECQSALLGHVAPRSPFHPPEPASPHSSAFLLFPPTELPFFRWSPLQGVESPPDRRSSDGSMHRSITRRSHSGLGVWGEVNCETQLGPSGHMQRYVRAQRQVAT